MQCIQYLCSHVCLQALRSMQLLLCILTAFFQAKGVRASLAIDPYSCSWQGKSKGSV